jgi:glyoxylate/hydroxypyruvate reductase A
MSTPPLPTVVFAGRPESREPYETHLRRAMAERDVALDLHMDPAGVPPEAVDYLIFAASGPVRDFAPYTRLRAILSLWAGVEAVLGLGPPHGVPLCRMIEPGLTLGMRDYVVGHVMRHHLDIDRYIGARPIADWEADYPPLARDRAVGVLGLGALGSECARALSGLGFRVLGWARSAKEIGGIEAHSGEAGLDAVLGRSEILVGLLPHTPATERLLDAGALARLPRGACIVNAGRGSLIDHEALLAALDRGHVGHATMDVFDEEPLPPDHPYWRHPRVTVTPHVASVTRPETASEAIVENIARDLRGEPLLGVVDRDRGY